MTEISPFIFFYFSPIDVISALISRFILTSSSIKKRLIAFYVILVPVSTDFGSTPNLVFRVFKRCLLCIAFLSFWFHHRFPVFAFAAFGDYTYF